MLEITTSELWPIAFADVTVYRLGAESDKLRRMAREFCDIRTKRLCHRGKKPLDFFIIQPSHLYDTAGPVTSVLDSIVGNLHMTAAGSKSPCADAVPG
jgi:hypothetical protein